MSTYIEVARHPLKLIFRRNRPLLSSKNPRFQNEARWTTFLLKMSFIAWEWKMITISKASTYPRFETEARENSEMAYWTWFKSPISDCQSWRFFFFSSKKTMGSGSFILLFTKIFREEDMRNSWTHFWHKLYGNCYTFNKGINDVGETTEVMNSSQAGLGNWLKFLQQTFILDFVVRYCISVLNSSEGRDRCTFWSLPNWISFIFLLNLSHGTRSYWEINI